MNKKMVCWIGVFFAVCMMLRTTVHADWTGSWEGEYGSDSWFDTGDWDDILEDFLKEWEAAVGGLGSSFSWDGQFHNERRAYYFDGTSQREYTVISDGDTSGSCGTGTRWSFDGNSGTLRISGTGAMEDAKITWGSVADQVRSVVVDEGVTRIGDCAFIECQNLTSVSVPSSVTSIGACAFHGCDNLKDVYYPGHRRQWNTVRIGVFCDPLSSASIHCAGSDSFTPGHPGFGNFRRTKVYGNEFSDIKSDAWYYENVVAAYELGLMTGLDANRFAPSENVSVAQILALACRLRSMYLDDGYTFEASSPWYEAYADYAMDRGLLVHLQQSDFDKPATRYDLAEILSILPEEMLSPINQVQDQSIPNVLSDDMYKENIYTLYRAGIISGSDQKGTFAAESAIPRSEIATIMARIANPGLRSGFTLSTEYVTLYADSGKSIQSPSWECGRYTALGWQRAPFKIPAGSTPSTILNAATLTPMLTNFKPLDHLVGEIFAQIFTDKMTTYDKVKACYDYLIEHTEYGYPDASGIPSAATDEYVSYNSMMDAYAVSKAYVMLKTGVGVCTDYASALLVMARRIGLDAYMVNGETSMAGGGYTSHTWNMITIGGVDYVFDAQVEDNIAKGGKVQYYRFCKTTDQVARNYKDYDIAGDKEWFGGFEYRDSSMGYFIF